MYSNLQFARRTDTLLKTHCIVSSAAVATLAARNETSTRVGSRVETSDSRFSDELQQGRLNLDVVFTTDVDAMCTTIKCRALETGRAGVPCLETMEADVRR